MTIAKVEQDEFAEWWLTIVEDDGGLLRVAHSYSPTLLRTFAQNNGIDVIGREVQREL